MAISPTSLAHAIHGLTHRNATHPQAPANAARSFGHELEAAAKAGPGAASPASGSAGPGGLLSADLLKATQTIG